MDSRYIELQSMRRGARVGDDGAFVVADEPGDGEVDADDRLRRQREREERGEMRGGTITCDDLRPRMKGGEGEGGCHHLRRLEAQDELHQGVLLGLDEEASQQRREEEGADPHDRAQRHHLQRREIASLVVVVVVGGVRTRGVRTTGDCVADGGGGGGGRGQNTWREALDVGKGCKHVSGGGV